MIRILTGDCMDILPTLDAESVQCCVTSPPYWGLRDYGTAAWEGGDAGCDHKFDTSKFEADAYKYVNGQGRGGKSLTSWTTRKASAFHVNCSKCGAQRIDSQLGLESTPEEYLTRMVAVFREVWRVLKPDGTLWVNIGDSYASGEVGRHDARSERAIEFGCVQMDGKRQQQNLRTGLKPKDLCMMPARVAMALQADGWYLRSDIIWHKPNPMPESVTDRPTKSHEYIFLLAKQQKYYYDADAIREAQVDPTRNDKTGWGKVADASRSQTNYANNNNDRIYNPNGRNKRTVWTVTTQPYGEAHFATFPEDLIKPCIMAGSRLGNTVLDPFGGSGTTGKVALELGRKAILIELNPKYAEMATKRTNVTAGML